LTLAELFTALKTLAWPVAYSHFTTAQTPPFITYQVSHSLDFMADNQNYHDRTNVQIELYTKTKDLTREGQVQTLLKANRLPYQKTEAFLDSENLFQVIYEIRI